MRLAESDDSYPCVVAILNGRGRHHPSSHALDAARNPTKPGTFSCLKTDRVNRAHWREAGAAALIQKHHALPFSAQAPLIHWTSQFANATQGYVKFNLCLVFLGFFLDRTTLRLSQFAQRTHNQIRDDVVLERGIA